MGLDAVEIVMEVEETFHCKIDDAAACEMRTVGDLYDYLVRIEAAKPSTADINSTVCLSAATFYRLRRGLMASLPVARRDVRTSTTLETLLPRAARRRFWSEWAATTQLELPELVRPEWLVYLSLGAALLLAATIALAIVIACGVPLLALFPALIAFFSVNSMFSHLGRPWAIEPQPAWATVGGLAHVVLVRNYRAISEEYPGPDSDATWQRLRAIIVEQLGVKPELVTRNARFVEDLGCE